ncbi:hypothetical protein Ciccas_013498, partial [Cichlidogyrus casuarinus]
DKPYSCSACGAAFTQGSSLKLHIKSRHNDNFQFFSLTRKPCKNNLTKLWTRVLKKDLPKINGNMLSTVLLNAMTSGIKPQTPAPVNPQQLLQQDDRNLPPSGRANFPFSPRKRPYNRRVKNDESSSQSPKKRSPQKRLRISDQINGLVESKVGNLVNGNSSIQDLLKMDMRFPGVPFPIIPSPSVMLERLRGADATSCLPTSSAASTSFNPEMLTNLMRQMAQYSSFGSNPPLSSAIGNAP